MSPKVASYLAEFGVRYRVITHEPLRTVEDAIRIMPNDTGRMVKSLAFARADGSPAIVALLARSKVDYGAIALAIGLQRKIVQLALPAVMQETLDMEPGALCPVGLGVSTVHIDPDVLSLETVLVGSGRIGSTLEIAPSDLLRLPLASVARVSRGQPTDA